MFLLIGLLSVISLSKASDLTDEVLLIVNNAVEHHSSRSILVIWWQSDPDIVTDFLNKYHGSVTTLKIQGSNTNNSEFSDVFDYKQTIFFAAAPEEFEYFLLNLNITIIYPLRVLLVITLPVEETSELEEYIKLSFDNSLTDILILSLSSYSGKYTISTFMPLGPNGCENYTTVTLGSDTRDMFSPKFNNFYGCPISIIIASSFPYVFLIDEDVDNIQGMDVDFLKLVFEKINATMIQSYKNDSGNRVQRFVANGTFDMSLPSIICTPRRFKRAQASNVFRTINVVLCAPNQREIYEWAKVILPFFSNITPLIILSSFLFMGVVKLIQRFGKYRKSSPKGIIFITLGLFLGQEMKFETKYWLNNVFFMLWIWYCTIVRIAYQGDLIDGLQATYLESHLDTVEQAAKAVDEYGGPDGLLEVFDNTSLPKNLKLKTIPWKDTSETIEEISKGRKFLLITDIAMIDQSPHRVQIVTERLSSLPQIFFMRPRWGAAREINRRMIQLFEAGFADKILRDYKIRTADNSNGNFIPLGMTSLESCFIGLVFLGGLLSIVLCVEIIWYRFKQNVMII